MTNPDNILDEFFNQTDSLILSKVIDLDNPNNVKKKLANKKRNKPSLSTVPEGIFMIYFRVELNEMSYTYSECDDIKFCLIQFQIVRNPI